MRIEAPPSRYRVIERGGRLVVIDSGVGGAPLTAKQLLPAMATDDGADARDLAAREDSAALVSQTVMTARPPGKSLAPEPPGVLESVAASVSGDVRDDQGRLLLTTARWYDARGPRTIALGDAAERRLGALVLLIVGAAIAELFAIVLLGVIGWVALGLAFVALRNARPAATAWIDRLATQ